MSDQITPVTLPEVKVELMTDQPDYLTRYKITLPSGVMLLVDDETNTGTLDGAVPQVDVWVLAEDGQTTGTVEVGDTSDDGFATWTWTPTMTLCSCMGITGRDQCTTRVPIENTLCMRCAARGCSTAS